MTLKRAESVQLKSAATLRSAGAADEAWMAEQFAARIRLTLEEPVAIRRIHSSGRDLRLANRDGQLFDKALEIAMSLAAADFGNIQLVDPTKGTLRIVAHTGFNSEFLEYFAAVDDSASACGRAAEQRAQVVIGDVAIDPGFAPHRDIAAASQFRSVQSTPLIAADGVLVGMISTHWRRPHRPLELNLELMACYADLVAAIAVSFDRASASQARVASQNLGILPGRQATGPALVSVGSKARVLDNRAANPRPDERPDDEDMPTSVA
jgi:GAF domain-containing protein